MKAISIKKLSRKSLSVFLAVLMLMSSMSVCFSTVAFAAGGTVSDYGPLANALNNDSVKNAQWSQQNKHDYIVEDADGLVAAAVEAYFSAFNTLANKTPATGNPNNTSNSTGSSESNRTINQINATIKAGVKGKLSTADYNAVEPFLTKLLAGADVSSGTGTVQERGGDRNDDKSLPASNISAISAIKVTVKLGNALGDATLDSLPPSVVAEKIYTVTHANDKYDYTYKRDQKTDNKGTDCDDDDETYYSYKRTYKYFYYVNSVTTANGASQDTSTLITARDTLASYADYFSMDIEALIEKGAADIGAVKTAVTGAKSSVVSGFGANVWNKLFKDTYGVDALVALIDDATEVLAVKPITDNLTALKDAGYDSILTDEAALRNLYATLTEGLARYDVARQGTKDYITSKGFVRADIQAFADNVLADIYLIELRALKVVIDNTIPAYEALTEDDVIYTPLTQATLNLYKGEVDGLKASVGTYPDILVSQVMRGYEERLAALSNHIADLMYIAGFNDEFSAEYAKYVAEVYSATNPNASSADLLVALKGNAEEGKTSYDAWYTGLKNLLTRIDNNLEDGTAEKILAEKDDAMKARMEATYEALHAKVLAQIDNALALYTAIQAVNGKVTLDNVNIYTRYKQAYKTLDRDSYTFLKDSTANFTMPEETIKKYELLKENYGELDTFLATGGFSSFQQIITNYVDREVLANDLIKDETYDVYSERVEQIITSLDALITSDEVGGLLGGLLAGEETAEAPADFSISEMVKGLISDMLFSDATINSIMQMLYPLILGELIKVWVKDLPTEVDASVTTAYVTYKKSIDQVAKEAGLPLFPSDVAEYLDPATYADNIAMLKTASKNYETHMEDGSVIVDVTPWTEENPNLFNEDGTMKLTWGVDAAKEAGKSTAEVAEAFYQGFDDALHCLKPLLNVLVGNTAWTSKTVSNVADIETGEIFLVGKIEDTASLTITADACPGYANLIVPIFEALGGRVGTTEALFNFESPATIEGYAKAHSYNYTDNSTANMLRAIFTPLLDFIDELGDAPLSTLIGILPNLCYALSMQMMPELLGTLSTHLGIKVGLNELSCADSMIADKLPSLDFNVGDMLGDFNTELIDLSDGVNSLLGLLGVSLPRIDQATIAQLGSMNKFTSARYATHYDKATVNSTFSQNGIDISLGDTDALTITADKGAVMYYLLQYIFGIVEDEEQFAGLLGMLMTKDVPVLDAEGNPTFDAEGNAVTEEVPDEEKIAETIASIEEAGLFSHGFDYAIAAIVELFAPEEYEMVEADWAEAQYNYNGITGATGATITYLDYSNDWTKEKATYLVDNIDAILPTILEMLGQEETDINALISGMINGLFTNDTLTGLISAIAGLGTMLNVGPELEGILDSVIGGLGADLTLISDAFGYLFVTEEDMAAEDFVAPLVPGAEGYRNDTAITGEKNVDGTYTWYYNGEKFEDGERDMFINILVDTLGGLTPVLMKIFKGEDLSVLGAINIETYNGYANSIGLLFEALGIEAISQAEFNALSANDALAYVINTLFDKLDAILDGSAVKNILGLLPNLIYFIESNGLSVVLQNLLLPILVLVDTVRPIFDLNINGILSTIVSELVSFGNLDAINIMDVILGKTVVHEEDGYEWIAIDIRHLTITDILAIVDAALGTNLIGSELGIYGIPGFCSGIEEYDSVIDSEVAKRTTVDAADAITILVTALIEALDTEVEGTDGLTNLDVIFGMIEGGEETAEIVKNVLDIIDGFKFEYELPNWLYMAAGQDLTTFAPRASITYLQYTTDWTEAKAQDVYASLDEVLESFLPTILADSGAENLAMFIEGLLADNVYNDDIFNMIVETIVNLFTGIDKALFEHIDVILDTNIFDTWLSDDFVKFNEETGKYECVKEWNVTDRASFKAALEAVLAPVDKILAFVFFGDGLEFFTGTEMDAEGNFTHNDIINVEGIEGYDYAIVPILEALGLTLPTAEELEYKTSAAVSAILDQLFILIDKLADAESTVEVVFELLPNLIYFINADGLKNSVNNLLNAADQIIAAVGPMAGLEETSVKDLIGEIKIGETATLDITDLSMDALLGIAGAYGVTISDDMLAIIKNLYVGQFTEYTSANGFTAYKLDVTGYEYDVLTIILSIAVDLFNLNEELFAGLLGENGAVIYAAIKRVIAGFEVTLSDINWAYMCTTDAEKDALLNAEPPAFPATEFVYLDYATDWTPEVAQSVYGVLDEVLELVLPGLIGDESIKTIVEALLNDNVYSDEILVTVVELIVNAIGGLDASLRDLIDVVLDTEINKWFDEEFCVYNAETDKIECVYDFGVDAAATTAEKAAKFIAGLEKILEPANSLLSWLFFGSDIELLNGTTNEVLITLNGGEGYAYGIAPILEALGLYMKPASEYVIDADKEIYNVSGAVSDILTQVLTIVDKLETYESTAEFVLTLLPSLLYFINADGLKVSVNNLIAPVNELFATISVLFGEELAGKDLATLINSFLPEELGLDVTDITTDALLALVVSQTGIVITDDMAQAIYNIYATGDAVKFDAANGKNGFRVDANAYDVLTVVLSFAVDAFNVNKDIFADLLGGEDIYNAIYNLIRGAKEQFVYAEPNWGYMYEGGTDELAANGGHMPKYPENTTAANYLLYKNNWNKDTAKYVNDVIDAVIAGIMDETSLGQMLDNAITNGFYKDDILNSLLSMIVGLIYDYADIIEGAGALIGAESIYKWFDYCTVDANGNVVVTHDFGVDEAATNDEKREIFVNAFVDVLEPAYGLLAWLLFDQDLTFFNGTTNEVLITLTGGRGYEEALVPLFEAVGAKMPGLEDKMYENGETAMKPASAYVTANGVDMETFVFDIFSALTGWLSQICGDLANQGEYGVIGAMLDLLPNVIYNINAGTVKAVVQNLLLPVEEILGHLEAFGLTVDFSSLIEIRGKALDIKNLDWYAVFDIVETLGLYWPDNIQDFLATLYLGEAVEFTSANGKTAYYVTYNADDEGDYLVYGREDMITHVISFVIDAVLDTRNAPRLSGWLGNYYTVIYNYLAGNVVKLDMQDMNWQLTEYADTGDIISPVTLGATINGNEGFYGELYTREMAEYIEKWLPSFVDTMIVLLGVQGSDGVNYEGLSDLITDLVGTSLYTTENLKAVLGLIQGLIPTLKDALPEGIFEVIVNVLREALEVDLTYWDNYTVAEIAEGDREAFVDELTKMFAPLYPILRWLLTGEDLIALFYTHEGRDALVVEGAEGYAYGIIPLLEAFDYQGNILTPDEFAALTDAPSMLEAILNPVLDVVDKVLADPVNEIFNVLPGVIYFLNSDGLDTVIKNTANAVFTVLENIEPATGEIDVYELIGFNAEEMNVETLITMLVSGLEEEYGVELTELALDALSELTVGTVKSFTSKNGETAYTVEYATGADRVDMVTLVLRTVLTFVTIPENVAGIEAILAENLDGDGYKFACSLLENFSYMAASEGGMDEIMYTVYQIFYAANVAAHSTEDWLGEFNGDYSFLNQLFKTSNLDFLKQIEISLGDLLNNYTGDIIDDDEIVPNGFIAFFQKIADFFKKIGDFFKNLFK